jgi:hypothetical protein
MVNYRASFVGKMGSVFLVVVKIYGQKEPPALVLSRSLHVEREGIRTPLGERRQRPYFTPTIGALMLYFDARNYSHA